jgi:hypothetical protein
MTEQTDDAQDAQQDATADVTDDTDHQGTEGDTFTREYVEGLRGENAKYRTRAQRADEFAHRLHAELVKATGRLADPADLDYAEEHLTDPEAMNTAINELLTAKPHLRKPVAPGGDVGQGRRSAEEPASLLGILKRFA